MAYEHTNKKGTKYYLNSKLVTLISVLESPALKATVAKSLFKLPAK